VKAFIGSAAESIELGHVHVKGQVKRREDSDTPPLH
jgi:hypothetical protein